MKHLDVVFSTKYLHFIVGYKDCIGWTYVAAMLTFFFFFLNYGCTDNWLQQTSLLAATSLSANKMMFSDGSG